VPSDRSEDLIAAMATGSTRPGAPHEWIWSRALRED